MSRGPIPPVYPVAVARAPYRSRLLLRAPAVQPYPQPIQIQPIVQPTARQAEPVSPDSTIDSQTIFVREVRLRGWSAADLEIRSVPTCVSGNGGDGDELHRQLGPCAICLTRLPDALMLPCRHVYMCGKCVKLSLQHGQRCAICRKTIRRVERVFLAV